MQDALCRKPSAVLALADGTIFLGYGFGATGQCAGELVFNTAMTGYQEILSDPSYAGQLITFTFPHVGNVGCNDLDIECSRPVAPGMITRAHPVPPSSWRNERPLERWLEKNGIIGISGIDTRHLASLLRDRGSIHAAIGHAAKGDIDPGLVLRLARDFAPMTGMDLVPGVTGRTADNWSAGAWDGQDEYMPSSGDGPHIVVLDYGIKYNILRSLAALGCRLTVLEATSRAEEVLAHEPDGIVLSNGPGDPAATGVYAVPEIRKLVDSGKPVFGICLGHQMLGLALGARTEKMAFGHHGANHPVRDLTTGKVEITSQNHGFAIADDALPEDIEVTHRSLFDGTIQGIRRRNSKAFSVQYHPEASPGPVDSHYLFRRFIETIQQG